MRWNQEEFKGKSFRQLAEVCKNESGEEPTHLIVILDDGKEIPIHGERRDLLIPGNHDPEDQDKFQTQFGWGYSLDESPDSFDPPVKEVVMKQAKR